MLKFLIDIIGGVYSKVPKKYRPYIKKIFYWLVVRLQSILFHRSFSEEKRVVFLDFEIAFIENFELLGPNKNQALYEAHFSCISPGTEKAVLCGMPGARRSFPYQPGYSSAGTIKKIGKNVKGFSAGDRLAGRVGHMSKQVVNPQDLFRIPEGVSYQEAAFVELGIIVLQGMRKARIQPGDKVAIVGQGLLGQLANKIAYIQGASPIIGVAYGMSRKKISMQAGNLAQFISIAENPDSVYSLEADVTIEAVGTPSSVETAFQCTKANGRLVLLGSSRGLGRNIDWKKLVQPKNLQIIGAHISAIPNNENSPGRFSYRSEGKIFLHMLNNKLIDIQDLITWVAKPEECNAVYEAIAGGGNGHVGIVFNWQ